MSDPIEYQVLTTQIDVIKSELDDQLGLGQIDESIYNKEIVKLSYTWAISGFPRECVKMFNYLKGDYFHTHAIDHFKEDFEYYSQCSLILEILEYVGMTPFNIFSTQPPAKA